jgi:hypothetical protein
LASLICKIYDFLGLTGEKNLTIQKFTSTFTHRIYIEHCKQISGTSKLFVVFAGLLQLPEAKLQNVTTAASISPVSAKKPQSCMI